MKKDDFISKAQRQRKWTKREWSFKKTETKLGICAAAILEVRLG